MACWACLVRETSAGFDETFVAQLHIFPPEENADKMSVGLLTTGAMSRFSDGSSSDRHHHDLNIACPLVKAAELRRHLVSQRTSVAVPPCPLIMSGPNALLLGRTQSTTIISQNAFSYSNGKRTINMAIGPIKAYFLAVIGMTLSNMAETLEPACGACLGVAAAEARVPSMNQMPIKGDAAHQQDEAEEPMHKPRDDHQQQPLYTTENAGRRAGAGRQDRRSRQHASPPHEGRKGGLRGRVAVGSAAARCVLFCSAICRACSALSCPPRLLCGRSEYSTSSRERPRPSSCFCRT
ncbi:predicted protein [Verticillium alfalfae VaMs.102]|uniref:Predicted protein n=1 Tax=Verticillium alfalfae (strain VaMs.102 / ATCC MYA-4576 / FGSC 10136) TaxID=526221 RepID=C9S5Z9_VERA1|nr:predicted protein [Verticillium alfalfae VaMs.102]EEY14338.1 predicted protein [Verticillium alfalfae VaMs.102]